MRAGRRRAQPPAVRCMRMTAGPAAPVLSPSPQWLMYWVCYSVLLSVEQVAWPFLIWCACFATELVAACAVLAPAGPAACPACGRRACIARRPSRLQLMHNMWVLHPAAGFPSTACCAWARWRGWRCRRRGCAPGGGQGLGGGWPGPWGAACLCCASSVQAALNHRRAGRSTPHHAPPALPWPRCCAGRHAAVRVFCAPLPAGGCGEGGHPLP